MIRGTIEALELVPLVRMLHDSGASGVLTLWSGERQETLTFFEGQILIPEREGAAIDARVYEEELYELLFMDHGSYQFKSRKQRRKKSKAPALDTPTVLVEASRRRDEWRQIQRDIPTPKVILLARDKQAPEIVHKRLLAKGLLEPIRLGKDSIEEYIARVGMKFTVMKELSLLCHEKVLRPVPLNEIQRQLESRLNGKPRRSAVRLFEWMHEVPELSEAAAAYDQVLLRQRWLELGGFSCRVSGPRALQMLSRLLRYKDNFEMTAKSHEGGVCVSIENNFLAMHYRGEIAQKPMLDRIRDRGLMSPERIEEAQAIAEDYNCKPEDLLVDKGFIHPTVWLKLRIAEFLDVAFSIFTWNQPQVLVCASNTEAKNFEGREGVRSIFVPLDQHLRQELRMGLMRWKLFRQVVPSMDAIFVCAKPTPENQPRRAHDHLDGRKRVSDLLAMARASGQELLQFIYRAVKDGRLRRLSQDEHRNLLLMAAMNDRHGDVLSAHQSALCFGYEDFNEDENIHKAIDKARREFIPGSGTVAVVDGRLKTLSLADVIQCVFRNKLEGTLRISHLDYGERILHFVAGELFVLLAKPRHPDSVAPNEFLTESTEDLLASLQAAFVDDSPEAVEEFQKNMTEEILEALFWERASFEFARNFIPSEFFRKRSRVQKLRIPEERLLFESMRRMAEWDDLRRVIRSERAIFQFTSPQAKLQSFQDYGEFVYFIDGEHTLGDIVKNCTVPHLELYRSLHQMIEEERIQLLKLAPERNLSRSDTDRIRWDLSA